MREGELGCALCMHKACVWKDMVRSSTSWTLHLQRLRLRTHVNKTGLSLGPEVPFDDGRALHLTPLLAGDAAQLEALSGHCLGVGVHLCTGPVTLVDC